MDMPTEDQRAQMQKYGIVESEKPQFTYRGYVYDRLKDALEFARIDTQRKASRVPD